MWRRSSRVWQRSDDCVLGLPYLFCIPMEYSEFSIVAWNMRGAAGKASRCHLKSLVSKFKPFMLILMETHVEFSKLMVFWKWVGYDPVGIMDAQGHMGGIWVLSYDLSVCYKVVDLHHQVITLALQRGDCV